MNCLLCKQVIGQKSDTTWCFCPLSFIYNLYEKLSGAVQTEDDSSCSRQPVPAEILGWMYFMSELIKVEQRYWAFFPAISTPVPPKPIFSRAFIMVQA